MYSIGIPRSCFAWPPWTPDDLAYVREVYPSIDGDLRAALRFANERHVKEMLGDSYLRLVEAFTDGPGPCARGAYQRDMGQHQP